MQPFPFGKQPRGFDAGTELHHEVERPEKPDARWILRGEEDHPHRDSEEGHQSGDAKILRAETGAEKDFNWMRKNLRCEGEEGERTFGVFDGCPEILLLWLLLLHG
jgi:hypothetical protein